MSESTPNDPRSRRVPTLFAAFGMTACLLLPTLLLNLSTTVAGVRVDCVDNDGDGYGAFGDPSCPNGPEVDCDDTNGAVFPGAREVCDDVNNDCDHPEWPSTLEWTDRLISESAMNARSVFAADVDGDDDLDVLSASHDDNKIAWYEKTAGDGSIWIEHVVSTSANGAVSVFAVDVDGDVDVDVLSTSIYDDKIAWYENATGDGSVWVERVISTSSDRPYSVYAVDLDGDGDVDAASASVSDDKVAWHENTAGDGSVWVEHVISTSADYAGSVFAADVDGDNDIDLLSASWMDDTVAWYENVSGDGSVWVERLISAHADQAESVFAADVDGDEDLDVLSASNGINRIAWYENVSGSGLAWIEHPVSTSAVNAATVFGADMDGDEDLDVLSAATGKVSWHENSDGDGSIWIEHVLSASGTGSFHSVFAADLDGDEYLDVFSAFLSVLGDSRIAWTDWSPFDGDHDGGGLAVCAGDCNDSAPTCTEDCVTDLDGDGTSHCADTCIDADGDDRGAPGGAGDECAGVDCNDDDPNNWISCDMCVDSDSDSFFTGCDAYSTINGPDCQDTDPNNWISCATCGDTDGDGFFLGCDAYLTIDGPDCDDSSGNVYPGASEICDGANNDCDHPSWPLLYTGWPEQVVSSSGGIARSAVDVDADGDLDVVSTAYGKTSWHANVDGDGSEWTEHIISASTTAEVVADLDDDGDVDVMSMAFQVDTWFENVQGDGSQWIEHIVTLPDYLGDLFPADLDCDGDVDLLTWQNDVFDYGTVLENEYGDGMLWTQHYLAMFDNIYHASAGDVDGDGDMDALFVGQGDYGGDLVIWWIGNSCGSGSWNASHTIAVTDDYWIASLYLADVDGDEDMDVVSPITWYENLDGEGTAWAEHILSTATSGSGPVSAADVDRDMDVDVLSAIADDGKLVWYENTAGNGTVWQERTISTAVSGYTSVVVADMDGDNDADVLSEFADSIAWYHLNWLEEDDDGDGLAECGGDCDDENASCTTDCTDLDQDSFCVTHDCDDGNSSTFPGAPETNDGVDNQCSGDAGHGLIDEISGDSGFHDPDSASEYSWTPQSGATQYEVVRFSEPADPVECAMFTTVDTLVIDPEEPPPGRVFNYVVRALAPYTGSWGQSSAGVERTNVCP